jgi:Tat protein secretion system quality control protein TatD with DNase activity
MRVIEREMIMIIDTHTHLNMDDFNNDLDAVLKRAVEQEVKGHLGDWYG